MLESLLPARSHLSTNLSMCDYMCGVWLSSMLMSIIYGTCNDLGKVVKKGNMLPRSGRRRSSLNRIITCPLLKISAIWKAANPWIHWNSRYSILSQQLSLTLCQMLYMHLRSMSWIISSPWAFPCWRIKYSSTHDTRWSLKTPLMSWWSISGVISSWISACGKPWVNGWGGNYYEIM